jgi:hypothetical protein
VDFIGAAMVVNPEYEPEYRFIQARKGNHAYRVTPDQNRSFEYLLFAAWSEGPVLNNYEDFKSYTLDIAKRYRSPLELKSCKVQVKERKDTK